MCNIAEVTHDDSLILFFLIFRTKKTEKKGTINSLVQLG